MRNLTFQVYNLNDLSPTNVFSGRQQNCETSGFYVTTHNLASPLQTLKANREDLLVSLVYNNLFNIFSVFACNGQTIYITKKEKVFKEHAKNHGSQYVKD